MPGPEPTACRDHPPLPLGRAKGWWLANCDEVADALELKEEALSGLLRDASADARPGRRYRSVAVRYFTATRSQTKISVSFGPITPPAPRSP
ncbi:hypothetical protein ABA31_07070 [Agrococcus baldri]|uniref:Uncharacterized protein n=1 Tax=Agrococcus baldri TaxID=153730 RepID=A0AA87RAM2_9MICO|nr:hypothetical protein ABA31_07070 [Agrococcus baldri]